MIRAHILVVTCCVHEDNDPQGKAAEIPGAVFGLTWHSNVEPHEHAQIDMRRLAQWPQVGAEDLRMLVGGPQEIPADPFDPWVEKKDDGVIRHRIRERCAGCGATIVMREATVRELCRGLENLSDIWRQHQVPGAHEAVLSLPVLARLAEQVRSRTR